MWLVNSTNSSAGFWEAETPDPEYHPVLYAATGCESSARVGSDHVLESEDLQPSNEPMNAGFQLTLGDAVLRRQQPLFHQTLQDGPDGRPVDQL